MQTQSLDRLAALVGWPGDAPRRVASSILARDTEAAQGRREGTVIVAAQMLNMVARAAAAHGMTVAEWEEHCLAVEAIERRRRGVDRQMRQAPRYRDAA